MNSSPDRDAFIAGKILDPVAAYDRLSMQFGKWDLMNTYAEADGKERISQDPTPSVLRRTIAL